MAEENKTDNNSQADSKLGCGAVIGIILLISAVLMVLWLLIVKPELESRGVAVDDKMQRIRSQAGELIGTLQDKAGKGQEKLHENTEAVREKVDEAKEKMEDTTEKVAESAGEVKEQVESWY